MVNLTETSPFYLLRIELKHAHRPIWREVEAPADMDLGWLHLTIQAAMGWTDSHLHEFIFQGRRFSNPAFELDEFGDASVGDETRITLGQFLKRARQKIRYHYDFGDSWEHDVILKKRLDDRPRGALRCVAGEGACPLEDCGGVWGHQSICAFLSGEDVSPDQSYLRDWIPEGYDPDAFDLDATNEMLASISAELEKEGRGQRGAHPLAGLDMPAEATELLEDLEAMAEEPFEPEHPYRGADAATLEAYRSVLEEGLSVRSTEPWKDLWDQDIFCIQDPDSGLVDIVSVLGAGGEVYAAHAHRGREGLAFWRRAMLGDLPKDPDAYVMQLNLLEMEFVNKSELEEPDLDLYDLTGLARPPRGRKRWMRLRRYRPRQPCWFHPPAELPQLRRALFLTRRFCALLREAQDRSGFEYDRAHENDLKLPSTLPGFRLKPGADPDAVESWEFDRIEIDWNQAAATPRLYEPSEHELARLEALPVVKESWETGARFLKDVMTETGPVVPIVAAVMPLSPNAQLPEPHLSDDPAEEGSQAVWTVVSRYAFERGALPERLEVTTEIAEETFAPLSRFGVEVVLKDKLELLEPIFLMMSRL